jgi:hypothetical protein
VREIWRGCLVDVQCRDVTIDCTLTLDDAKLLHKQHRIELPPLMHSTTGIALLAPATEQPDKQEPTVRAEPTQDDSPEFSMADSH